MESPSDPRIDIDGAVDLFRRILEECDPDQATGMLSEMRNTYNVEVSDPLSAVCKARAMGAACGFLFMARHLFDSFDAYSVHSSGVKKAIEELRPAVEFFEKVSKLGPIVCKP